MSLASRSLVWRNFSEYCFGRRCQGRGRLSGIPGIILMMVWALMYPAHGHPHYVSMGTARWIEETQSLEVELRVSAADLEDVLTKQLKREFSLDPKSEAVEDVLRDYIVGHVAVITPDKRVIKAKWIGYEIEEEDAWIYVELVLGTPSMKGYWMQNTTLIDAFEEQVNMVNVIRGTQRKTLRFRKRRGVQAFPGW